MSEKKPFDNTGIVATKNPATMVWPSLGEPKPYKDPKTGAEGKPKFQATFILPADHPDLAELKKAAVAVARAKWPGCALKQASNAAPLDGIFWPFKNGSDSATKNDKVKALAAGKVMLSTSSVKQPTLCLIKDGALVALESAAAIASHLSTAFYSGVDAIFEVNFKAWDGSKGEKYVSAYVNAVVSYGTGEKITGAPPVAERFKGYVGQKTTEDPTSGSLDDEIPF